MTAALFPLEKTEHTWRTHCFKYRTWWSKGMVEVLPGWHKRGAKGTTLAKRKFSLGGPPLHYTWRTPKRSPSSTLGAREYKLQQYHHLAAVKAGKGLSWTAWDCGWHCWHIKTLAQRCTPQLHRNKLPTALFPLEKNAHTWRTHCFKYRTWWSKGMVEVLPGWHRRGARGTTLAKGKFSLGGPPLHYTWRTPKRSPSSTLGAREYKLQQYHHLAAVKAGKGLSWTAWDCGWHCWHIKTLAQRCTPQLHRNKLPTALFPLKKTAHTWRTHCFKYRTWWSKGMVVSPTWMA